MKATELKHGWLCPFVHVYSDSKKVQLQFFPNKYVEEKTLRNWFEYRFPKKQLTKMMVKHLFASHHGDVARGLIKESIRLIQGLCGDWVIEWEWDYKR